jgi:hypothetical protein
MSHNLALLERLFHLLQVGQVTDIGANPLGCRAKSADSISNTEIDLDKVSRYIRDTSGKLTFLV